MVVSLSRLGLRSSQTALDKSEVFFVLWLGSDVRRVVVQEPSIPGVTEVVDAWGQ